MAWFASCKNKVRKKERRVNVNGTNAYKKRSIKFGVINFKQEKYAIS